MESDEITVEEEHPEDLRHAVLFRPLRCPLCGSPKHHTYGRKWRVRYHRCHQAGCRLKFKSIEDNSLPRLREPYGQH